MEDRESAARIPPFLPGYRSSGLLLHVTSLPSPYGIGDVGPAAFVWVDRLHDAGQGWWQALPLGSTGSSNSPYRCLSSFAGNGLLISPELLMEDGLLHADECRTTFKSPAVDYDAVIPFKHRLLGVAWNNFRAGVRRDLLPAYEEFCHSRTNWLEDYALFRVLKSKYNSASYLEWPAELIRREPSALAHARQHLASEIDQVRLAQFLLFNQAKWLKEYAHAKNVRLIGDLLFFVSADSSDVWANPELFQLDEHYRPRFVAGVPPDYFSATGQLWNNPVYDWEALRRAGYAWCIDRIRALLGHVNVIRLDHLRGFAAAWHVPTSAPTAETGEWVRGPGASLFKAVRRALGALPFIAEDLGVITPDVPALRDEFHLPGTRVLQFAFDGRSDNIHLPHNYPPNTVVNTGTHDNATTRGWFEDLPDRERWWFWAYLRRPDGQIRGAAPELMRLAWSSPAALTIAPFQDLLNLGSEGRMNVPGRPEGKWRWRPTQHMLPARAFQWLGNLTKVSNRSGSVQFPVMEAAS
jgi:4-alpha-glucanotransferase